MKKTRKILLMAACAVLLVCISVGATVAYLTSTDSVTNTFTVGNIAITLDETKVDVNGKAVTPAERVKANAYKLMPGHEYVKDPTIHVAAGSENCYLFVKVENGITALEAPGKTIADQMAAKGWVVIANGSNVYYLTETVDEVTTAKIDNSGDVVVFEKFTLKGDADTTNANANYATKNITVTAYAVQADGFATAKDAWDATFGAPSNP